MQGHRCLAQQSSMDRGGILQPGNASLRELATSCLLHDAPILSDDAHIIHVMPLVVAAQATLFSPA